ncbi:acyl-CoA thioesterase FadM [Paraburkholderia sp. GAS448]
MAASNSRTAASCISELTLPLRVGPVVMKGEIDYFRELHLLDRMTVRLTLAGLSDDGSRMVLRKAPLPCRMRRGGG